MSITLTGTFTRLDGTPATGTVRVTPSRSPIMDSDGKVVISGPQVFPLDKDGKLTTEIPASDDPDLGPAFTYSIDVNLTHAPWKISKVWIPHGSTTVDLSEIGDYTPVPGVATRVVTIPADGADGQVLVWDGAGFAWDFPPEGPQGPPGEVTTAALATALAGKVTGTGMTLRHDTTVGTRVLLDHPGGTTMLMGDTGWRTLSSWDTTGTVTGQALAGNLSPTPGVEGWIRVRRENNTVTLAIRGLTIGPVAAAYVIQAGFNTGTLGIRAIAQLDSTSTATAVMSPVSSGSSSIYISPATATKTNNLQATIITWPTNAAWPATLPGLPA